MKMTNKHKFTNYESNLQLALLKKCLLISLIIFILLMVALMKASATVIEIIPKLEQFIQNQQHQQATTEQIQLRPVIKMMSAKKYQQAITLLQQLRQQNPDNITSCYLLGLSYVGLTQWQKADTVTQQCISIDNKWPVIYNLRGPILAALGQHKEALQQYNFAIALAPKQSGGYLQRAKFLYSNNKTDKQTLQAALADAAKYIQYGGNIDSINDLQGLIYLGLKQTQQAEKYLLKAVKLQPDNLAILAKLLPLYYQTGKTKQAQILLLKSSKKINVLDKEKYSLLKTLEARQAIISGNTVEVDVFFQAAIKIKPDNIEARKEFIYWLDKQERLQETISLSKQGLTYMPEDSYFTSYLAWALSDNGTDIAQAQKWLDKAKVLEPENVYLSDTQAWLDVRQGKYQQALQHIQPSIIYAKQVPEIAYHTAVILYNLGKNRQAIKYLELSLKSQDSFNGKTQAKALLSRLSITASHTD